MLLASLPSGWARAQGRDVDVGVSIVYTGRSLGALGVLRAQDEHELVTEQANVEGLPFRLVSHPCWRAPGISIFLPTDEPEGDELPGLLAARATAERTDSVPALRSNNVLLVQDPARASRPDMMGLLFRNQRTTTSFPDLTETYVSVLRLRAPRGEPAIVVEEEGAVWPDDPAAWTVCEMNRIDILLARLYELPANLGEIGPRATVLADMVSGARQQSAATIVVDLGQRGGDVGIDRAERARIDFTALRRMSYSLVVPFEFELALGAEELAQLKEEFPEIGFLAANVKAQDPGLFETRRIIDVAGVKLGLFGLVDLAVQGQLPRAELTDYTFESPIDAAEREVRALRTEGADAVVALSNLHPRDNAALAQDVSGIDVIVADLHERWSPESMRTEVALPDRPRSRPGSPALVARGFANGLGVGRLDLAFRPRTDDGGGFFLASVSHALESVTDRTPADVELVAEVRAMATVVERLRGDLMFPAFVDLMTRHPELKNYDETTALGRVSKRMWEEFMARLIRNNGRAEVAVIPTLPFFPPLIGKLHEAEVRNWLWTEDEIVLLDLQGADLRKVLLEDTDGELVVSGIDRNRWTVGGRRLDDRTFYRVATTDLLFEGARFRAFEKARRVRRNLQVGPDGSIVGAASGTALSVREFVLGELRRERAVSDNNDAHIDRIAAQIAPDPPYENLLMFSFDRPTLWVSLNQTYKNDGYRSVPESRVTSLNSWVVGVNSRFKLTHDRQSFATDLGLRVAYARQSATLPSGSQRVFESADDLKLSLTLRPKTLGSTVGTLHPFVRGLFDTEFTPTVNFLTGTDNTHQRVVRGVAGVMCAGNQNWRNVELGAVVENDFGRPNVQFGIYGGTEFTQNIGPLGNVSYRVRNEATYLLPAGRDNETSLALRYNMVHELTIPLVDELSLSIAADFFFFQGKVGITRDPGVSMLLRVGLTYDRLWKPRYQPLF